MTFEQAATILTAVYQQATGQIATTPLNTGDFVSVAQTALKTGYDPVLNAISQVLSRTIFSIRPYNAKLKGMFKSPERYGNHVRKINYIDGALENDERFQLVNGQSIDHWKVNKPKALQTNFYGSFTYQRHTTILKDQLDNAMTGPGQFSEFITGQMQNVYDQLEQVRENYARMTLNNMIAGKYVSSADVHHVLSVYNGVTGQSLSRSDVMQASNFPAFIKWLYGYIQTLVDFMGERSIRYHLNVEGSEIMRHTPKDRLKAYLNSSIMNDINASVLGDVFHDDRLRMVDYEPVAYWQNINEPFNVNVTPTYMDTEDGTLITPENDVLVGDVIGVLFDEEACGVTLVNQWSSNTGLNAAGGYSNTYFHEQVRTWNDFSENFVVLCLD